MKKTILFSAAAIAAVGMGMSAAKEASASTNDQVPLYRLYNPNSGEHFYTTSYYEAQVDYDAGWNIEGVGWQTPSSGDPVYRLFNPNARDAGSHYYTMSSYEASHLQSLGWIWENNQKALFYSGGSTPVYVDYNPNDGGHNYTTSRFEADNLIKAGWKYDALAMHATGAGNQDGAKIHPVVIAPAPEPAPVTTAEKDNAVETAKQYQSIGFNMSRQRMIDQLKYEGFGDGDAQYGADNAGIDWNANALAAARTYSGSPFNMSKSAIYDQLVSEYGEKFTPGQAQYAIDHL
ncbi:MAG: Ltp family lipoprotein [Streptococcaceae bacterium]|jgi:hypothetical protein|nr:Ltp family lipoprotein [Streptococcaceae bacterium]